MVSSNIDRSLPTYIRTEREREMSIQQEREREREREREKERERLTTESNPSKTIKKPSFNHLSAKDSWILSASTRFNFINNEFTATDKACDIAYILRLPMFKEKVSNCNNIF
jgi:hypothetical protein